jgi:hypothetical protein
MSRGYIPFILRRKSGNSTYRLPGGTPVALSSVTLHEPNRNGSDARQSTSRRAMSDMISTVVM